MSDLVQDGARSAFAATRFEPVRIAHILLIGGEIDERTPDVVRVDRAARVSDLERRVVGIRAVEVVRESVERGRLHISQELRAC